MIKCLLIFILFLLAPFTRAQAPPQKFYGPGPDPAIQVSQYIRRMLQDKAGNIWFGTNGDGVCRYNPSADSSTSSGQPRAGRSFVYFTPQQGFAGRAVRGMLEDDDGNIWFATDGGVSCYSISRARHPCNTNSCKHDLLLPQDWKEHMQELAASFTNITAKDGLGNRQVWCICRDKAGSLWFGTEGGVYRYNLREKKLSAFQLPVPDLSDFPNAYQAPKLVNTIFLDKAGILWFGTNGKGVYRYDPSAESSVSTGANENTLTNFSEQDGLCNNFVQCIIQDKTGELWFGTRFGGLSRYNGTAFKNFTTKDGLSTNFIWTFLEDKNGSMWLGTAGGAACRYDPPAENMANDSAGGRVGSFTRFTQRDGLGNSHVQSFLEDRNGNLWVGTSGGVFRYGRWQSSHGEIKGEAGRFTNFTTKD
jgi:ligand-binding sensor domain-containing protein